MTKLIFFTLMCLVTACGSAVTDNKTTPQSQNSKSEAKVADVPKPAENKAVEEPKEIEAVEIYDGRDDFETEDFPESETKPVQAEFDKQLSLIKDKMGESFCDEVGGVSINGIAKGSFTKPKSNQKAVLYDVCRSGSSHFGVGGILVFEDEKAVSHYVYGKNGLQSGLKSSPDINKNGVNELLLIDYQMHQGNSGTSIIFAEIKNGELKFLGDAVASSSNSGATENDKDILSNAYVIFAQPSANPLFLQDSYEIKGNGKDWKQIKKQEKLLLIKENLEERLKDFRSLEITQWN